MYDYGKYILVCNTKGSKKNHSHFSVYGKNKEAVKDTCHMLIRLMENERIPRSNYLLESAIRLTNDKEYKAKLLEEKERRLGNE